MRYFIFCSVDLRERVYHHSSSFRNSYINMVLILPNFIRPEHEGRWEKHNKAKAEVNPRVFYGYINYSHQLPVYIETLAIPQSTGHHHYFVCWLGSWLVLIISPNYKKFVSWLESKWPPKRAPDHKYFVSWLWSQWALIRTSNTKTFMGQSESQWPLIRVPDFM